jgi:hypothetical protein
MIFNDLPGGKVPVLSAARWKAENLEYKKSELHGQK